jgi:hypothetical protein
MGTSIHLSPTRKMRGAAKKTKTKIVKAYSIDPFCIAFEFDNRKIQRIDFLPIFQKYVKGENLKYLTPSLFKKFKWDDGRIFWGKNEEIAFSISSLLEKHKESDDILYII